MNPTSLQKRVLGALAVAGLAATLAGPAYAAKPLPIIIEKAKRSAITAKSVKPKPVRADAKPAQSDVKPLPITDPPVFLIPPTVSSIDDQVPPRMPPGFVGPPVQVPPTATSTPMPVPTKSATPPKK